MMKLARSGLIALVFLAGCAFGGASSQWAAPPAVAQDAPTGTSEAATVVSGSAAERWDYYCFDETNYGKVTQRTKIYGQQGWRLRSAAGADSDPSESRCR